MFNFSYAMKTLPTTFKSEPFLPFGPYYVQSSDQVLDILIRLARKITTIISNANPNSPGIPT